MTTRQLRSIDGKLVSIIIIIITIAIIIVLVRVKSVNNICEVITKLRNISTHEHTTNHNNAPSLEQTKHPTLTTMSHLGVNDFIDHSTKHPTTPSSSSSSPLPTPSLPKPSKLGSQQVSDSFEVYQAKFKYDPTKYSPNDNPDLELSFEIGDYLFVYGLPDEDGFFVGESMDGKKGFVPSNFVEKVPDETLIAIKSSLVVQRILSPPSKVVESNLPSPTKNISIVHETKPTQLKQFTNQSEDCLELNVCELVDPKEPPPPKDLRVERQLANSVMIAWSPPVLHSTDSTLKSYSVYVDGHLQCLVDAMDRTKALLERIELSKVHRVCLRCNYSNHMDSADQQCTIMIGTGINYSPTDFRVSNVTSFTAEITWMPSNSNLEHIILVDGRCRAAIRPGNYKCIVTGLAADTRHSISIQPRVDPTCPGSTKICITFKTLPSEIPDAPVEVQVEAGPRQGTLLVMWAPVRPNGKPPNSSINGYCVYVNGKKIKELHSPIGDHVLLESEDFMEIMEPKHLTIRSITHNHESIDSLPFLLSPKLLSELSFKELPVNSIHLPTPHANSTFNFKTPHFHQSRDSKLNHHEASFSAQQLSPLEKRNAQTADTNQQIISNQCIDRCRTPSKMDQTDTRDQADTIATRDNVSDSSFEEANRTRNLPRVQNNFRRNRVMQEDNNNYARMDALNRRSKSMRRDGQKRSRYFLALFDYDPAIMSPNPDGISEELPFKEGQIIKVHGSKDADGFYMGELSNGMRGLVPSNMINEIDEPSASRKPRQTFVGSNTLPHQSSLHKHSHRNHTCEVAGTPRQMIAMQNFDPIVHPPNRDIEPGLPFRVGELIFVHGAVDCNGYYRGEKNGVYGLVPADFLRDAQPNEQQFSQQIQIPNQIRSRHESYSSSFMCNNQSANQREGINHLTNQHSVQNFDPRSESFMSPQSQVLPNVSSSYKPSVQPTFAQQPQFSGPHPQHSHPHQLQQHSNQLPHQQQQQHPNQPPQHQQQQHSNQPPHQQQLHPNQLPQHQQQQHPNQPPQHQQQQHSNQLLHQQQQYSNQQFQQFSQHPQQHFQQQAQHLAMLPQHSQQQLSMYSQQHQLYPQQTVVPQRLQHLSQQQMEHFQSSRDPPPGIRYQQQPQHQQQQQMESKLAGIDNFHQRGRQDFEQRQMLPQQQNFQQHQPSFNQ